jgi:ribosome-binding protein aMBF1 (putative translation factor)
MKTNKLNVVSFSTVLDEKYGKIGTPERILFDIESKAFRIGVIIKEARLSSNLTQEELANRIGTKKSYISRIERGLCDLQVNTLIRIIEKGLGRKFEITII